MVCELKTSNGLLVQYPMKVNCVVDLISANFIHYMQVACDV